MGQPGLRKGSPSMVSAETASRRRRLIVTVSCSSGPTVVGAVGGDGVVLDLRAIIADRGDLDVLLGDLEVVEAVLRLAVPVPVVDKRRGLGGDAAAASRDEAGEVRELARPGVLVIPELLVVTVPCHQEVQAHAPQLTVPRGLVAAREVRHDDLPLGRRLPNLALQPDLLALPQLLEPAQAQPKAWRPTRDGAARPGLVVLLAADVVLGVLIQWLRVHDVGVDREDVHAEMLIRVVHLHAVVGGGHDPAVAVPRVGNLLIPAVVEHAAAPVVVAEDADPGHAIKALPVVDILEDLVELVLGLVGQGAHGVAAVLLDASPVEVVADVQDELWVELRRVLLELLCDKHLRLGVKSIHEAAAGLAVLGVVAVDELLVAAEQHGVVQVVARAREGVRARLLAALVDDEAVPVVGGHHVGPECAVQAAPVADAEEVGRAGAVDRQIWPRHALVRRRDQRCPPLFDVGGRVERALVPLLRHPILLLAQLQGAQGALPLLGPRTLVVDVQ
mmetsp:Transcript_2564/g.5190  ORF Transcript_2564/g.5190 Transcript_2564/m.5190 type:complete len:503 (+) Transcript_2564:3-1511(+)